jgi:RNA polymerase sigma factor (sigma-70 family)
MTDASPVDQPRPRSGLLGPAFPGVLAAAQADAGWAYQRLFRSLAGAVASYLRGQGAEDPDGLANEVFMRAFRQLQSFDGTESGFRSWVFTIARNALLDERRRQSRRPLVDDRATIRDQPVASGEVEALARLGTDEVRQILDQLVPDQRDVLLLRVLADLSVEQVAAVLGKQPGAVKQLQRRAAATLRRRLGTDIPDGGSP